jgi:malyl-CoA/(S)-citramalyl-CoA lyase
VSFTRVDPAPQRVNRSELAVPAHRPRFIEKAAQSDADVVFLDLEDAVPPDRKAEARRTAIEAINDIDWGRRTLSVRINGLDTPYMYRDVVDLLEQAGERLDLLMIPKVGTGSDVYALDMLVTQIEAARGRSRRLGFELIIETALGMSRVDEIAAASRRNESLHFGVADYAASVRARTARIGGPIPDYAILTGPEQGNPRQLHWNDPWHYAVNRIVVAARAAGLRPVDGPFGDIADPAGFEAAARRAAALGCAGKWAIHPSQIESANSVFSPSRAEVDEALGVVAALEEAEKAGQAAVVHQGRLIDLASIRQAQAIVAFAETVGVLPDADTSAGEPAGPARSEEA